MKTIFKALLTSLIILLVATIISLGLHIICEYFPVLYWILAAVIILYAGYFFSKLF